MGLTDLATALLRPTMRLNVADWILPEDDIDEHTFVCKDQSVMSMLRLNGLFTIPGEPEVTRVEDALQNLLKTFVVEGKHSISLHFAADPAGTGDYLEHCMAPARAAAKAMDVAVDDIIDENVKQASEVCVYEEAYLVLWSHASAIPTPELREARKRAMAKRKTLPVGFADARNLLLLIDGVENQHRGFVEQVRLELARAKLDAELVERHEVLLSMRRWADASTGHEWRPILHGDVAPPREALPGAPRNDISNLLWPPIDWQVGRAPAQTVAQYPDLCEVGGRYYASILVQLFPQEIHRFHNLFERVPRNLPWRMVTHLNGGADAGIGGLAVRRMVHAFTRWASSDNAPLTADLKALELDQHGGDGELSAERKPRVRIQMHFVTWAQSIEQVRRQSVALRQAVEGWGSPQLELDNVDPVATLISSVPGATYHSMATPSYGRVEDVVRMLPLSRPSSPWRQGAMVLSTSDGKAFAYQPGSSQQAAHIDAIFAKSGNGKSVLSNALNTAMLLKGGSDELPDISVLDIGPSAAGQVRMVRKRLPASRQHEAVEHRMTNNKDHAYNILDTELGMRMPLPPQNETIRGILRELLMAPGEDHLHPELSRLLPLVIEETYNAYSDQSERGKPKIYSANVATTVDGVHVPVAERVTQLAKAGRITLDTETYWWEVVDALFTAGYVQEAIVAQRHAVPTLPDMVNTATTSQTISAQYGDKSGLTFRDNGKESVAEAFARILGAGLREFPLLSEVTRVDYARGRIKVMDLEDVAPEGDEAAKRQAGIMYAVALQALTGHYSLDLSYLAHYTPAYRDYHEKRIRSIRSQAKRVVCDELHRAPPRIVSVLERLALEGRKKKFSVGLISQQLGHFSKNLIKETTSRFILGQPEPDEIEAIKGAFHLSETDVAALKSNLVHPPRPGKGSAFLAMFTTKAGTCTQVLGMRKGPIELWSYSTTPDDNTLAHAVATIVGPDQAEIALALSFPGGSAQGEIERRAQKAGNAKREFLTGEQKKSLIDALADEVAQRYNDSSRAAG